MTGSVSLKGAYGGVGTMWAHSGDNLVDSITALSGHADREKHADAQVQSCAAGALDPLGLLTFP